MNASDVITFPLYPAGGDVEGPSLTNFQYGLNDTNGTDEGQGSPDPYELVPLDTFIGLVLAFSSCFLIGISVIYKKLALKDLEEKGGTRAVDGGYGYLRLPKWWLGIMLMGLGELSNFVAYIFAPAILVTPLGVFSIVCTAALSPYFLKERLNAIGKLGCVLVIVGCFMVTLCGPKDREVTDMEELKSHLFHQGFLIYMSIVVGVSFILIVLVPKFGHKYVMLYITICSSFGSLSVMFCKGVGLAIKQTFAGENAFTSWVTWVCLVALITCLLIETIFMQRALDIFNSSVFMSINYVMFTSLVIVASSILYTELRELGWKNIVLTFLGFVVNIVALYLLHLDRKMTTVDEVESPSNVHPELDQETPLVARENNNDSKDPECSYLKAHIKSATHSSSPLSAVKLTPSLLRGNQYLSFLSKDKRDSAEANLKDHDESASRRLSLSSSGDPSCSSEGKHYSLSESNASSLSSVAACCQKEDSLKDPKIQEISPSASIGLSEVPLINELQANSRMTPGDTLSSISNNQLGTSFVNTNDNVQITDHSNRMPESISETDDIAHLV